MADPVSLTGLLISAVAAGCAIVKTAAHIKEAYDKIRIDSLPSLNVNNVDTNVDQNIFSKLSYSFKASLDGCELIAVNALCNIYDSYANSSSMFKMAADVTLTTADAGGNYIKMLGTTYMCIKREKSDNDSIQKIEWMINNLRGLKTKERNTIGVHKCYVITLDSIPSYATGGIQEEKEYIAIMSLVGEVISRCIDHKYDGHVIKVGFGRVAPVNYLSKINVMVEADWNGAPVSRVIRDIRELIIKTDVDMQSTIEQLNKMNNNIEEKNIILLGESGSGKSHTANMLYNYFKEADAPDIVPFRESKNGACTSRLSFAVCGIDSRIKIWDTPGLLDEYKRDGIFAQKIQESLLEIGQVSAIILCEKNLERTDRDHNEMIRKYASIIGQPMQNKLIIAVNRQLELTDDYQKDTLIQELSYNDVRISKEDIYDLLESNSVSDLRKAESDKMRISFISKVMSKCAESPVKLGIIQELHTSLEKMKKANDENDISTLKEKLVNRSADFLKKEIINARGTGEIPRVLSIQTHQIVFEKYCRNVSIGEYLKRWSLESNKVGSCFTRALENIVQILRNISMNITLDEAINTLKNHGLVFLKRSQDKFDKTVNNGMLIKTQVYILVDVNSAFEDSALQYINDVIEKNKDRCINVFD